MAFPNIRADRRTLDVIPGQPPDLRNPPPGCRFAPRCGMAMPVCSEVVPPEVRFPDGVRTACHLYPTTDADPVQQMVGAAIARPAPVTTGSPPAVVADVHLPPLPPGVTFQPSPAPSAPAPAPAPEGRS